jgi:hypothetical protein
MRKGEDERSVVKADTTMLSEQLGISPEDLTPLGIGVERTVAYFREYLRDR